MVRRRRWHRQMRTTNTDMLALFRFNKVEVRNSEL